MIDLSRRRGCGVVSCRAARTPRAAGVRRSDLRAGQAAVGDRARSRFADPLFPRFAVVHRRGKPTAVRIQAFRIPFTALQCTKILLDIYATTH
jgi:hypothetical protein